MATTTIDDSCATQIQIIDGEGVFKVTVLDNFIKTSDMANTGLNYAVVGIIGPQSSGKSTLMNTLFHAGFKEMNASKGRYQTTKGIWIDKCAGIEPCTFALDIEGTDGRERGEDDTAFEKQSALFALAVSDIVLINLWCHDVGREQAASKPLLRTVFQAMLPLLTSPRKITLIFVLRDKTPKTPLESLESILREDIQKVSELRKRFYHSTAPGGLAGDRCDVVPASGFSISAQKIWKSIRENKDLNLPAHKVMVATMRCEAIAKEKLDHLRSNKGWLKLMEAAQSGLVQGFGKKLNSIIATYRSHYDEETEFFDEAVRNAKRKQLETDALNEAYLSYTTMIGHLRSKALADFKTKLAKSLNNGEGFASSVRMWTQSIMLEFEKGSADAAPGHANWDASKVQSQLRSDIDSHAELLKITMEAEKSAKTLALVKEEAEKNAKALAIVKEEMVSTMRCEAIAKEKLDHLRSNKGWLKLMEAAQSGLVQGFGKKLNSIIATYRSQYDEETEFYDEAVRNAKWKQLESDALNEAYLSYTTMIGDLRSKALADFKTKLEKSLNNGEGFASSVRMCTQSIMLEFEKGSADTAPGQTNWDVSKVQDELRSDIDSHAELLGKFFCSDNDSHAELLERKPRLKEAEKSAKTLKLVKEVAIATAVGAAVGVAGVSGMAAVIVLTGAAAVGTGAVAVSVVALAAPVLSVMYSVYEIINKYKNRAKPVKDRA